MKKRYLLMISALCIFLNACGPDAGQRASNTEPVISAEQTKVFVIPDYEIEVTCPSDWKQVETENFDLKCTNGKNNIYMSIFANMEIDLSADLPVDDLFTTQNHDVMVLREHAAVIEEESITELDGRRLYSTLRSAERNNVKNYYYMNMVYYKESGHIAWVLFNGMPSDIIKNRETLDAILLTIKPIEQE